MSSGHEAITDTVVLLYFLLVGEGELLTELLGGRIRVPRAVYDPEDRELPPHALRHSELLSEMRQSVRHYEVAVRTRDAEERALDSVRIIDELHDAGVLEVVDMRPHEVVAAADLQSRSVVHRHPIRVPLGAGEAACVAIAWHRTWTIVTDDEAALTVMRGLSGGEQFAYERIRKLLIRAANDGHITEARANEIHVEMRDLGFWDRGTPFPNH